jgi:hypothetical protein
MHDPENLLRRFLRVRHFQRQSPGPRDRAQKKSARGPRRQSHLPRLQHNVSLTAPLLKPLLYRIGPKRRRLSLPRSHFQQSGRKGRSNRASAKAGRPLIQNVSQLQ